MRIGDGSVEIFSYFTEGMCIRGQLVSPRLQTGPAPRPRWCVIFNLFHPPALSCHSCCDRWWSDVHALLLRLFTRQNTATLNNIIVLVVVVAAKT